MMRSRVMVVLGLILPLVVLAETIRWNDGRIEQGAPDGGRLVVDMTGAPLRGGKVRIANRTFAAADGPVLTFRNQYAGHVEVEFDRCVFDARGGAGPAVVIENDVSSNPFGGVSLRYVELKADDDQPKLDYWAKTGVGMADVLGNVDLAYGTNRVGIVPFAAFIGLPWRDATLDPPRPLSAAEEAGLATNADRAWNGILRYTLHPKTDILYEAQESVLPTPEEIARHYPNVCGWCTGMEDGLLAGGPLLLAALARIDARGGHDEAAEAVARRVFRGLMTCAEVSGVPGFLARAVSPFDGKSFYPSSSRDQYTLFVYAMWRAFRHPFAAKEGWKPRIAKVLADVAAYCERTVTKENGWSLKRADGGAARVSKMWTDDVRSRTSDGRGSIDFGGIYPHEMARLPMIYAAAWDVTGDRHWRGEYEKYADDALDMSELRDPASERVFALLQMQVSLSLLHEVERNESRRARLMRIMTDRTKWALLVSCPRKRMNELFRSAESELYEPYPDWRKLLLRPLEKIGTGALAREELFPVQPEARKAVWAYVRETGERMMMQVLCPGWRISDADERGFAEDLSRVDFSRPCWTAPAIALWYYWERQKRLVER